MQLSSGYRSPGTRVQNVTLEKVPRVCAYTLPTERYPGTGTFASAKRRIEQVTCQIPGYPGTEG